MVVTTDKFAGLARLAADQSGIPEARIVTVTHPLGGVKRESLEARADAAVEDVIARLLASG